MNNTKTCGTEITLDLLYGCMYKDLNALPTFACLKDINALYTRMARGITREIICVMSSCI